MTREPESPPQDAGECDHKGSWQRLVQAGEYGSTENTDWFWCTNCGAVTTDIGRPFFHKKPALAARLREAEQERDKHDVSASEMFWATEARMIEWRRRARWHSKFRQHEQRRAEVVEAKLWEAEQRNPEVGFGYYYHDGCSLTQGDGESTVMLYRTDELQAQVNKETRRATAAEARVTALEAALNGLWRYADHHSDCVLRRTVGPISDCACGFGQAESIVENALKGEAPSE